jgi:4-amino-4-deoxy-L-arabinose transferase-like glycosyltransferase
MEWLAKGQYTIEALHPPLARVMTAIGPFLAGARPPASGTIWEQGLDELYQGHRYDLRLTLARAGILPFFWIASAVVYLWALRISGLLTAVFSVLVFTNTPAILAHSGLATTDMALTAGLSAALLTLLTWIDNPSLKRSVGLGAAVAFALLAKFSTVAFLPACAAGMLALFFLRTKPRGPALLKKLRTLAIPVLIALAVCAVVIWAGYRFSFDHVPAPEFFQGIKDLATYNNSLSHSYLLGVYNTSGFWYYYEVALFYKTPIAILLLAIIGAFVGRKSALGYVSFAALGLLILAAFSHINIGIRHVLPLYLFAALMCGAAIRTMLESSQFWPKWVCGGLVLWLVASVAASHPDYLPYFNAFAGSTPEDILVDSDLDWGQDMKRLSARLKELGAQQVTIDEFIPARLQAEHGFPPIKEPDPVIPGTGWNAISLTMLKYTRLGLYEYYPNAKLWTEKLKPVERVGHGVLLYYYVPPK